MKILVIDDDAAIRMIASAVLGKSEGVEARAADGGHAGIRMAREDPPDVILLDDLMPDLDGPDVLELLRADPALARVPVIFVTAHTAPEQIARFVEIGACGVIGKPFQPDTLLDRVRELLDRPPSE